MKRWWMIVLALGGLVSIGGMACSRSATDDGVVEVPLTFHDGHGPFLSAQMGLYIYPGGFPHRSMYPEADPVFTGIPDTWSEVSVSYIETDRFQFLYQNYRAGKIDPERYERQMAQGVWWPDTAQLSPTPIRCFVGVVSGLDAQGVWKVKVDQNGNLDFRDDPEFEPLQVANPSPQWLDSMAVRSIPVEIECFSGGQVLKRKMPLLLFLEKQYKLVLYDFPYYAIGTLDGHRIGVVSAHLPMAPAPFTNPAFRSFCVAELPDSLSERGKLPDGNKVFQNDYLILDDVLYIPLEVDLVREVLCLQRTDLQRDQVHLLQKGFQAPSFQGKDLISGKPLSLTDYRGRYLLLEFWSDQCAPCLGAIPAWNALCERMDTTRVAMLGILYGKDPDRLVRLIEQQGIRWPQIRDDRINWLYQVAAFPSSYLLGPDGVILERNLTPDQFETWMNKMGLVPKP